MGIATILSDLRSIDYDQVLRFARYSEPMAHDHIYDMVTLARRYLPKATIDIMTNGDYLSPDALVRLRAAGSRVAHQCIYAEGCPVEWRRGLATVGERRTLARPASKKRSTGSPSSACATPSRRGSVRSVFGSSL